jgi:hypothetical protein
LPYSNVIGAVGLIGEHRLDLPAMLARLRST